MAVDPGGPILAEDKTDKAMAAVGKSHDKGPGPTRFAGNRIDHRLHATKIDLRLASRFYLQSNRHRGRSPTETATARYRFIVQ